MPTQKPAASLESTLADLKSALLRHRHIFEDAAPLGATETAPTDSAVPSPDPDSDPIERLAQAAAVHTGLSVSDGVRDKLRRILAPLPASMVGSWLTRLEALDATDPEWMAIIESLTVHETFFFRDTRQMAMLRDSVLPDLLGLAERQGEHRLRLWSAGCSTGEEAYTLAILALEAMHDHKAAVRTGANRLAPALGWGLSVLGTDISRPVITRARQGLFHRADGLSSFRDQTHDYMHWFDDVSDEVDGLDATTRAMRVAPQLRSVVGFDQYNLCSPHLPSGPFDLIACRNVLIYMQQDVRRDIQARLAAALRPGGYLILGPTDQLEVREGFETLWSHGAVCYRKTG